MEIIKHCNLLYYKDFDTASNFSPKILRFRKKLVPPLSGSLIALKSYISQSPMQPLTLQTPKSRSNSKQMPPKTRNKAFLRYKPCIHKPL
jgi:hypothetical protein